MPDKRLIDANALDLVPDVHNAMNGVIFVNHPRSGGRTQMIVQQLLTRMISNAPTIDAVPVVRCKDCKHRGYDVCPMWHDEYTYDDDDGGDYCVVDNTTDNGFCHMGAKMDGGADDE